MKYLLFIFCLLVNNSAFSQTLSFRCNFTGGQITDYDSGNPKTKRVNDFVELVYDQIDKSKSTARLIGNVGVAQVQAIEGSDSIHLIETTPFGNINITTIFFTEKSKLNGRYPVVHSRHMKSSSGPLPQQYIGLCKELLQ
jgi:hypothetical protein